MYCSIVNEEGPVRMYETNYERIYNYIFFHLLDIYNTEDLVGDIFLRAFSNRARYDKNRSSLTTWMFTIAKNMLIDYYRKKSR